MTSLIRIRLVDAYNNSCGFVNGTDGKPKLFKYPNKESNTRPDNFILEDATQEDIRSAKKIITLSILQSS